MVDKQTGGEERKTEIDTQTKEEQCEERGVQMKDFIVRTAVD